MNEAGPSLQELHRDIIVNLAAALGNLRLIAIGAPFASELIGLAQTELEEALTSARGAEELRAKIDDALGTRPRTSPLG